MEGCVTQGFHRSPLRATHTYKESYSSHQVKGKVADETSVGLESMTYGCTLVGLNYWRTSPDHRASSSRGLHDILPLSRTHTRRNHNTHTTTALIRTTHSS